MFERVRRRPKNRVTDEQIVQINSIRIYYREYGSGPPLILIHGLSGSGRWWRRNIDALAEHYHVYVVDLIGFGRSSRQEFALSEAAESLAEWMEYLGIDSACLIGHSMGGFIAADLASRHPDKVERLVLVDAAILLLGRTHLQTGVGLVRAFFEMPLGFLPVLVSDALSAGLKTILGAARDIMTSDISTRLPEIKVPTLLVWGERDWLVPLQIAAQLCYYMRDAEFIIIQDSGHNPMWDRPDAFNQAVLSFLQGESRQQISDELAQIQEAMEAERLVARRVVVEDMSIFFWMSQGATESVQMPLILVHGLSMSSNYMLPVARALAPDLPLYVPDLPGFGRSHKPDHVYTVQELADFLVEWMETMGIGCASFLGNSLGCQIVADLALRYPERIEKAILVGPSVDPHARTIYQQVVRLLYDGLLYERPSLIPLALENYLVAGPVRTYKTFRSLLEDPIEHKMRRITIPTLVVRGDRDLIVPQYWVESAAARLPNGRLLVMEETAHAANHSSPFRLAEVVRDFLYEGST
jgi:2-hydroxy-6-oxonona-2,4-dienedioate hydrolase